MNDSSCRSPATRRGLRLVLLIAWLGLSLAVPVRGQVSPEEHKKHHPGQEEVDKTQIDSDGMNGTMESMGGMMEGMGTSSTRELYPSLMNLPELTASQREEIVEKAHQRMQEGTALLASGLDDLARGAEVEDAAAMQSALVQMREGLSLLESGISAKRAVAEGKAPREIATDWFKREMSIAPPDAQSRMQFLGLSLFHFFVMALLFGFAVAMIWLYFRKMRRASQLLQGLTGVDSGAVVLGSSAASAPTSLFVPAIDPPTVASADAISPSPTKWNGKLRVARIFQETPDVKTFRLMNPLGGALPFAYLPGQFLTVAVSPEDKQVRRSYTIASSPTQRDYAEIAVKHEEPGLVSGFLHNRVKEGDLLVVAGPSGSFTFTGRECKCILLIAGGVGITPLMSVLRYLTDRSWTGDIYLLYGIRTPQDFIYREELEYLQRRHANLHVTVAVSRPEGFDWNGPMGRITKNLIAASVPDLPSRYVHVCGPTPMMEAVKRALAELGVPGDRIRMEAFGPALGRPEPGTSSPVPALQGAPGPALATGSPKAIFTRSGKSASLPPDKVVLDVADEIGVEIDNSCRVGTCGICRVKLLSGQVTMAVEDGLEPGDKENGVILACQAKSTGDVSVEA